MARLDDLNRRLGEIQDELMTLESDDFTRKNDLHAERDRLRDEAAGFSKNVDLERPSSELIKELKQRQTQLDSIARGYINPAKAADAGFGSGAYHGPADAQTINRSIDEAAGRARVEQRIAQLEGILRDRGHL
jgi:hypothetical protein